MLQKINLGIAELHRPTAFAAVFGHDDAVARLRGQIENRTGRSIVLHGPSGCGKSTLARIYAEGLLCRRGRDGSCGEDTCPDCRLHKIAGHPNLRTLNFAMMDDSQFAREINKDLESEILSDGWLVIWIDQADRMTSKSFEILKDRIRRPPLEVTFILCVEELGSVPPSVATSLYPLQVSPPDIRTAGRYLRHLCDRAEIECADDVLSLIAEVERPSFARLALNLERVASFRPITSGHVADVFNQRSEAKHYLDSCFSRSKFEEQWSILWSWSEAPKRKVDAIGGQLSNLLDPTAVGQSNRRPLLELEDRQVVSKYLRSSEFDQVGRAKFISSILDIWRPEVIETRASLMFRASRFEELLGAVVSDGLPPEKLVREWAKNRKRSADAGTRMVSVHGDSKDIATGSDTGFLSVEDVRKLWDAASFMVQNYGALLNARIVIQHRNFDLKKESTPAELITDLFRELRIRLKGKKDSVHWLYVHRHSREGGLVTDIVAHLPVHGTDVDVWIRDKFLSRRVMGGGVAKSAVSVSRLAREKLNREKSWRRHLTLIRLLCGSLNKSDPEGARLMRVLGNKRFNHSLGKKATAQQRGVSRGIDVGAQHLASWDLSVLSPFMSSKLSAFSSGWEMDEYQYRQKLRRQRIALENEVRLAHKGTSELDARLKAFTKAWKDAVSIRNLNRDHPLFS